MVAIILVTLVLVLVTRILILVSRVLILTSMVLVLVPLVLVLVSLGVTMVLPLNATSGLVSGVFVLFIFICFLVELFCPVGNIWFPKLSIVEGVGLREYPEGM